PVRTAVLFTPSVTARTDREPALLFPLHPSLFPSRWWTKRNEQHRVFQGDFHSVCHPCWRPGHSPSRQLLRFLTDDDPRLAAENEVKFVRRCVRMGRLRLPFRQAIEAGEQSFRAEAILLGVLVR